MTMTTGLSPYPVSCRICDCTQDHACPGGCSWVVDAKGRETDLCSRCALTQPRRWGGGVPNLPFAAGDVLRVRILFSKNNYVLVDGASRVEHTRLPIGARRNGRVKNLYMVIVVDDNNKKD